MTVSQLWKHNSNLALHQDRITFFWSWNVTTLCQANGSTWKHTYHSLVVHYTVRTSHNLLLITRVRFSSLILMLLILSRVSLTKTRVWVGESVYSYTVRVTITMAHNVIDVCYRFTAESSQCPFLTTSCPRRTASQLWFDCKRPTLSSINFRHGVYRAVAYLCSLQYWKV
jgi:hypothetical protein